MLQLIFPKLVWLIRVIFLNLVNTQHLISHLVGQIFQVIKRKTFCGNGIKDWNCYHSILKNHLVGVKEVIVGKNFRNNWNLEDKKRLNFLLESRFSMVHWQSAESQFVESPFNYLIFTKFRILPIQASGFFMLT